MAQVVSGAQPVKQVRHKHAKKVRALCLTLFC